LEPPRENPYDPYNQAYFAGTAYDHNWNPLEGARVKLKYDHEIKYETVTNSSGWFEFPEVVSRTYTVLAEADYYINLYIDPVCIPPSSIIDTFDLYFHLLYFDFENEVLGTQEPHGFVTLFGTWQIQQDQTNPGAHSTPNVYNATHTASSAPFALAVLRDTVEDFWLDTKIKVVSGSSTWNAGLALRIQDDSNYYVVQISSGGISVAKIENGNPVQLGTTGTYTFNPDQWYCIGASIVGTHIEVYLDDQEVLEVDDNTSPFYAGAAGLWIHTSEPIGSASANFDDIYFAP
jgi:hypothetical protein